MRGRLIALVVFVLALVIGPVTQAADVPGFVGMEIQNADLPLRQGLGLVSGRGGVMIRDILPNGPAARASLQRGDLVISIEGVRIESLNQVVSLMQGNRPGQTLTLGVWRDGAVRPMRMTTDVWPPGWGLTREATAVSPDLGVTVLALTPSVREAYGLRWGRTGVVVQSLEPTSPLRFLGVNSGDLIVAVGRIPLADPAALGDLVRAAHGNWVLLIERTNQVYLVGPGGGKIGAEGETLDGYPVVAGETLLSADLPDGPYVMDVDVPARGRLSDASLGADASLEARPGAPLTLPQARPDVANAVAAPEDQAFEVASLTSSRRHALRLRWASRGVVVTRVQEGSRAARAGLVPGHVITAINNGPPPTVAETVRLLGLQSSASKVGDIARPAVATLLVEARDGFFLTALPLTASGDGTGSGPQNDLLRFVTPTSGALPR